MRTLVNVLAMLLLFSRQVTAAEDPAKELVEAAAKGDAALVASLLDKGAPIEGTADVKSDTDFRNCTGCTALVAAAGYGRIDVMKLLLERGARVDGKDQDNSTPLMNAAGMGQDAAMGLLLDKGADVNVSDKNGLTAVSLALHECKGSSLKLLLDKGAKTDLGDLVIRNAFVMSATQNCPDSAKDLLRVIAVKGTVEEQRAAGLMLAVMTGDRERAKSYLSDPASRKAKDSLLSTAAVLAVMYREDEVLSMLLDSGADPNASAEYFTLLMYAVASDRINAMKILMNKGADVNAKTENGDTVLMIAASFKNQTAVKYLLEHGANVKMKNDNERTALFDGAESLGFSQDDSQSAAIVTLLVEKGAEVNDRDLLYGMTPLMAAARQKSPQVAKYLLSHGADPNVHANNNATALRFAVNMEGNLDMVKLLINSGADVNDKVSKGRTPRAVALSRGFVEKARYLQSKGGKIFIETDGNRAFLDAVVNGDVAVVRNVPKGDASLSSRITSTLMLPGFDALMLAAAAGDKAMVTVLLEKGLKVTAGKTGSDPTALSLAANSNSADIVRMLLRKGMAAENREKLARPVIEGAVRRGYKDVVRVLIDEVPAILKRSDRDPNLVGVAASNDRDDIIQLLADRGMNIEAMGAFNGETALMEASRSGKLNAVDTLLKKGANVNATDKDGRTALILAARNGNAAVVKTLLKSGAKTDVKDIHGMTALGWARVGMHGWNEISRMLKEAGVKE